ncbi:MAG: hypothetical protein V1844_09815 [Pseudomonadota bacterium]
MTTTGILKSLARLGYVRSIADQYEEQMPDISDTLKGILGGLRSHCDSAMQCWQEKLNQNDLRRIGMMLLALGSNTPLGKKRDITTYTAFGLCLLEDMTPLLKSHKKAAVDQVKLALLNVHNYFSAQGEYFQCLKAGADGADVWDQAGM